VFVEHCADHLALQKEPAPERWRKPGDKRVSFDDGAPPPPVGGRFREKILETLK
jgi:hypothetical protein